MLDLFVPATCPGCGRRGVAPCTACWTHLRPAPPAPPPDGLTACRALLVYDGVARDVVARVKYRNQRNALPWLASGMARLVERDIVPTTVVTWPPTTTARRRHRGFDQAELLARGVAARLGLNARPLLERATATPQTGRAASERLQVAFSSRRQPTPASVLLVDDVITTGATLSTAAHALLNGGTRNVVGVAAARTPLKLARGCADA